jgi:hypothetical protein
MQQRPLKEGNFPAQPRSATNAMRFNLNRERLSKEDELPGG